MKNKKVHIYLALAVLVLLFMQACIREDYYDYSDMAAIKTISISSQNGAAQILTESDSVVMQVANGTELESIILTELTVSSLAEPNVEVGDTLDFSSGSAEIIVTSESSTQRVWTIVVQELGTEPQLADSDFDTWYDAGDYLEIGTDENSTIWGSSNPGVVVGGIDPNTLKETNGTGAAIKMITRYSTLGAIAKKPIAAGSAFTGYFDKSNLSISDPQAALYFGTPFTAKPTGFSVDYKYISGPKTIDKNGNNLGISDSCDIYVLLEHRAGDTIRRVATGWLRTSTSADTSQLSTTEVELVYGQLPAGTEDYMLPSAGEGYAPEGTRPTHITVVFSSSAHGDEFQGAKNSTLWIDNFVLKY